MGQRWLNGYSADVEIYLLIGDKRIDVAQISDDSLIRHEANQIPPGTETTLVINIDGREERERIFLRAGAESREEPVPFF